MDQVKLNHLRVQDRTELEALLIIINGAKNAIRRDECSDWIIAGSRGTIRACDGKFYVYISCHSPVIWNNAKKKLSDFTTPSQDGDQEGILLLSQMPATDDAEMLRNYIGLRQTREVTEEQRQAFNEHVRKAN